MESLRFIDAQPMLKNIIDCVRKLLEYGANPNVKNSDGQAPLHLLVTTKFYDNNFKEMIKLFMKNGASLDVKDGKGKTPIEIAKLPGNPNRENIIALIESLRPAGGSS